MFLQSVYVDDITISFSEGSGTESGCLLGIGKSGSFEDTSYCLLLQVLGGLTIAIGILLAFLQCITCNFCGLGGIFDLIFAVAGAFAWLATAIVTTDATNDANSNDDSLQATRNTDRRNTVSILAWVEFGLFAVIVLSFLFRCCS